MTDDRPNLTIELKHKEKIFNLGRKGSFIDPSLSKEECDYIVTINGLFKLLESYSIKPQFNIDKGLVNYGKDEKERKHPWLKD